MIELLDYVLDYEDNFWIVNIINDNIMGYMVYCVDNNGDRFNNITKKYYKKKSCHKFLKIPKYKMIFKPKEFYLKNKYKLPFIWLEYVKVLNEVGINDNDIGIFGSFLIGFDIIKDVDFVIYGEDNLLKYYYNNEYIKNKIGATYISDEHIEYQYNKYKNIYSNKCDLREIISRNWSGVQIGKGVLSTPRFIIEDEMIVPNDINRYEVVIVEVLESIKSACMPRVVKVKYLGEIYKLYSSLWKYQSFAHRGDIIECFGSVNHKDKIIILSTNECYIKYLKKTNMIL